MFLYIFYSNNFQIISQNIKTNDKIRRKKIDNKLNKKISKDAKICEKNHPNMILKLGQSRFMNKTTTNSRLIICKYIIK